MALALYRKYRPATFAEVVGQEHVTEPLRTALAAQRINHAYLFSGPRGCGKTSSARILARSLNCEQGPTPDPCGVCDSCIGLAPEGAGTVDVVELDAASHGGVDDARELRDRAFYAPAASRYRVFIVDEAHMVTTQGFNALLKIVEEPPEHLVFIFATTEPDKVLPTIRSRTHHYPFRLIPPGAMRELLERNCADEGATVEPAVFPLVIRAGGGSARDTQSVLDQLLSGAGPEGVTYERAVALLGVTDVALIDDLVDGLAAADSAAVFGTVDRLVEAGHDPRRFAADLLDRLRDLVLIRAVPDAASRGLVNAPGDELDRMSAQAQRLGPAALTRFAEIVHNGLVEMRGATAPRLLLELLCARMLLPSAVSGDAAADSAVLQRLERMERRVSATQGAEPAPAASPPPTSGTPEAVKETLGNSKPAATATPAKAPESAANGQLPASKPAGAGASSAPSDRSAGSRQPEDSPPAAQAPASEVAATSAPAAAPAEPAPSGALDATAIRRVWSELLTVVRKNSRSTEAMLSQATVHAVEGDVVTISHTAAPLARRLAEPRNTDAIAEALRSVLGGSWLVRTIHTPADSAGPPAPAPEPTPAPQPEPPAPPRAVVTEPALPEPPDLEDYDEPDPVPRAADSSTDMLRLLTDKLGARPID